MRDPDRSGSDGPARGLRSVVVSVGDELLYGETVDTNAAWLGRRLAALGLPVARRHTVGDSAGDIGAALSSSLDADLVIVSGGLGPTRDDLTRAAVAGLFRMPLREDPALLRALEVRFRDRGYERLPEPNRSQALVPEGGSVVPNRYGTAPGLAIEREGTLVVLLPGVPRELRGIFEDELEPLLRARFGDRLVPVVHRFLHTAGVPESRLSELLEQVLPGDLDPLSIAFLPDRIGVDLRFTARGLPESVAIERLDALEELVAPVIAPWRFESETGDLADAVVRLLRERGATLGVAESCTGGLLAHRITRLPGVSDVFLGGVVAYDDSVKKHLVGVPEDVLVRHGAVSEEVAGLLATGAVRATGADFGVGITGVAGPGGGSEEKPVGTVWYAVASREGGGEDSVTTRLGRFSGDREDVQARAAQGALALLREYLLERGPEDSAGRTGSAGRADGTTPGPFRP